MNYTLPIGIDPKDFISGLQTINKGLDSLETSATGANKEMQDAFNKTVLSGEALQKMLTATADKAKLLRDAAKLAGQDIAAALSGKGAGKGLEEQVQKFQNTLLQATKGGKINLDIVFNEATIRELQKGLQGASTEMSHFKTVLEAAKVSLGSLQVGTPEFESLAKQIAITEGFMEGLGNSEDVIATKSTSLRSQLRAMREELSLLEDQGKENTPRFLELSIAAGKLQDQIGDTQQQIRTLASDTKYIDAAISGVTGLIGAMTAAQGATALFGDDNEELQKSLQKVTGAMALLQGIQAVANTLNKDSALSVVLLSRARQADAISAGVQTAATVAEGVAAEGAAVATNTLTAALLKNPITLVITAIVALVGALYLFSKTNDSAKDSVDRLNKSLADEEKLLALDQAALKRRTELAAATADLKKNNEQEVIKIQGKGLQDQLALQNAANQQERDHLNAIRGFSEEEVKVRQDLTEKIAKGEQTSNDIVDQINLKGIELQKQRIEDRIKIRDEVLSLTKQLNEAQIAGLGDQSIRQKAAAARKEAQEQLRAQTADLKAQILISAEGERLRGETIEALKKATSKKIKDIDRQEAKDLIDIQMSADKMLLDMAKEGQDDLAVLQKNELESILLDDAEKVKAIIETYKGDLELQDKLIEAVGKATSEKRKEVRLKYAQQEIDQELQIQTSAINLLFGFQELPRRVEEQKQKLILIAQIQGAEQRLQALRDAGKKEGDVAVIVAKEEVGKLNGELDKLQKDSKHFNNIFDVVGLTGEGGLNERQIAGIQEGVNAIIAAYHQVTDAILAANKKDIDSSTERINAFQTDIDNLQGQLDRENDLRKKGYANNAAQAQKDLDDKKKLQAEEIKNRHELFEKQKAIQRQQLILDTISQGSSLVTASANVLEGFSTIPIVGPVLGILAVGAMIAGFIAAKISAFNAINNQKESFGEGGTIDGKKHSHGGKKYRAIDGSGVIELESDEEVIRAAQAEKYRPLLKAINNDSISGMSINALGELTFGNGVTFETDIPETGNKVAKDFESAQSIHFITTESRKENEHIKAIRSDVGYLADRKREEVETWEDGTFNYSRKGNTTTKIRKP